MLRSVEAQINTNGIVEVLEPIDVPEKTRAIVILLDEKPAVTRSSNGNDMLEWLDQHKHISSGRTVNEVDKSIEEQRGSWD